MNRESSAWDVNVTIEILTGMDDGALEGLENAYLTEIGEAPLSEDARARLSDAIRAGRIVFVVARVRNRAIGMCSVTRCFSTFACADIGIFEDFFVEPNFREKGVASRLASAAQAWCETDKSNGPDFFHLEGRGRALRKNQARCSMRILIPIRIRMTPPVISEGFL